MSRAKMTRSEFKKLETILAKIELLQNSVSDSTANERLMTAKNELLRLHSEAY